MPFNTFFGTVRPLLTHSFSKLVARNLATFIGFNYSEQLPMLLLKFYDYYIDISLSNLRKEN